MGKRDFLKLQGHAHQLGLGINNLLHTSFGQKENINRWNNFGLENRYSFDSAILDRIPSFRKKSSFYNVPQTSLYQNTPLEIFIFLYLLVQEVEEPELKLQPFWAFKSGLELFPHCLSCHCQSLEAKTPATSVLCRACPFSPFSGL